MSRIAVLFLERLDGYSWLLAMGQGMVKANANMET